MTNSPRNIPFAALTAFAIAAFFSSVPSVAQEPGASVSLPEVQMDSVSAVADPELSDAFNVRVEWRVGPAAWQYVGDHTYTVKEARDAQHTINFRGDPYRVQFNFQGVPTSADGNSIDSWQIGVTRQDFYYDNPVSRLIRSKVALVRGKPGVRLVTYNTFRGAKHFRLTFTFVN